MTTPAKRTAKKDEFVKAPMVTWLDPDHLKKTALEVFFSTILGRHSDKRVFQALASPGDDSGRCYYEVQGRDSEEFWFDYIADVGDGFDSTYTMAYHLTRDTLDLSERKSSGSDGSGKPVYTTKRGEILVFGGDEVYPLATDENYDERLIGPYCAAFPPKKVETVDKRPYAFAIPGNHDWYDSLVRFSHIFRAGHDFAGWRTAQHRSYFAIKLPRGWWLFATDMQLASSLDDPQVEYFTRVMDSVNEDDRIILCNAEPYWITETMYAGNSEYQNRGMGFFEGKTLKERVGIYIAGDWHYYRHHKFEMLKKPGHQPTVFESSMLPRWQKRHKFVAGGGGAFLHPTHGTNVEMIGADHKYKQIAAFPDETTSWYLTFWNLLFPLWNRKFWIITGVLYLFTAQAFFATLGPFRSAMSSGQNFMQALSTFLTQPLAFFWIVVTVLAFIFFTDTHKKGFRAIGGTLHALSHIIAVFVLGLVASNIWFSPPDHEPPYKICAIVFSGLFLFAAGGLVGSMIMGLYLFVSLNFVGTHHNEAFSSIKIADYKNFLRLRIDPQGDLTIFPVGVKRVTRKWTPFDKFGTPHIAPKNDLTEDETPFLIEEPIEYQKAVAGGTKDAQSAAFGILAKAFKSEEPPKQTTAAPTSGATN